MVKIYPFCAVRPDPAAARSIAAVPYDVVTADEARSIIAENPTSFLRVSRSDAELPDISPHDIRIYQRARDNFVMLERAGLMLKDATPGMYIYRVTQDGKTFTGLCCCLDVDDYLNNRIKRHEQTRYDKEEDRTRHIGAVGAHTGPVVLLYRDTGSIFASIESLMAPVPNPDAEVHTDKGIVHQIFQITDQQVLARLEQIFSMVPSLYIADGHHRAKAAINVAEMRKNCGESVNEEVFRFMGVLFAHDRVRIHGYSRLLTDLGTYTPKEFMHRLNEYFCIKPYGEVKGNGYCIPPKTPHPERFHVVHMYLGGRWYECSRALDHDTELLESLDVAVLQKYVLEGLLGITDPRSDARLQYLGGARPVGDLERLVKSGDYALAFAMQPVRVDTVIDIADADGVMPPKSTWFEPKLLSGLIVHAFE